MVLLSMLAVFVVLGRTARPEHAWAAGYAVYWVAWGVVFPVALLGGRTVARLLYRGRSPTTLSAIGLVVPPVLVFAANALPALPGAAWPALAIGLGFTVVNGLTSELLWRGTFVQLFPSRPLLAVIYPAIAFGAWHLVPAASGWIHPRLGLLVAAAAVLGLLYGYVTYRTRTVRWAAASHGLTDLAGVSTYIALLS